jgi:hypothetical protein
MKNAPATWLSLAIALSACAMPLEEEAAREELGVALQPLSTFQCKAKSDTGYEAGKPFGIKVVTVDGELVERNTANAYSFMAKAAQNAGVQIRIVSGFRTMAEQQYLYNCYVNCSCNNCNLAAVPGYSNHQSGEALDLNTSASGVLNWLNANAGKFGFVRTVPSEPWHWEYKGGKPVGGPCGTLDAELVKISSDAPEDPSGEADFLVCGGDSFTFQVEMRNVGTARWAALGDGASHVGERVRMAAKGEGTDPYTGKESIAVSQNLNPNVLPASWGGGAGEPCNDAPGCRRTVFTEEGLVATAPEEPGIYVSSWRMRDYGPLWDEFKAFGPAIELSFRVETCAPDPAPPGEQDPGPGDAPAPPDSAIDAAGEASASDGGCSSGGRAGDGRAALLWGLALFWWRRKRGAVTS